MVLYMNCVPSFTRKLLILEKISSYNNTEAVEVKKYANCDVPCYLNCPDECKDDSVIKYLSPTSPVVPPPSSHHSSSILLLMLCILGAALFFVCYLSMIRYRSSLRNYRRRNSQPVNDDHEDFIDENQGPVVDHPIWYIRTVGLQQSIIESIEVFKYRKGEGLIEGIDCSVCLSEFQEDENLRLLPKCSHAFHIHCIDTWLRSHKNCPLCRAPIVNDPNAALLNTGEPNFSNSGSREENQVESVDNHADSESDERGENGTIGMRVQSEGTVSLPIEEENNVKGILEKNYGYGPAKKNKMRGKSDLADHSIKVGEEMEPVRRSISMGSSSAAMVYLAMANYCPEEKGASSNIEDEGCSNVNMVESMKQDSEIVLKSGNRNSSIYRFMKSSSLGRSLQKVPTSVKRSFSSSGKSSLHTAEARIQTEYNEH